MFNLSRDLMTTLVYIIFFKCLWLENSLPVRCEILYIASIYMALQNCHNNFWFVMWFGDKDRLCRYFTFTFGKSESTWLHESYSRYRYWVNQILTTWAGNLGSTYVGHVTSLVMCISNFQRTVGQTDIVLTAQWALE